VKPRLELTSVPPWTVTPTLPDADRTGASWTVVAIGAEAGAVVDTWCAQIASVRPTAAVRVHRVDDAVTAVEAVDADLAEACAGWRLMVAGPAHECLRVRAHAVRCDVADDEMIFAATEVEQRTVLCVHCHARTTTTAALEDTVVCNGCGRNLFVYYHVSRRQGAHLGFMVDAERPVARA
jgi:hypothetical protein